MISWTALPYTKTKQNYFSVTKFSSSRAKKTVLQTELVKPMPIEVKLVVAVFDLSLKSYSQSA